MRFLPKEVFCQLLKQAKMEKITLDNRPLISVIMPAYNRQETIAYSIESVLNQTYDFFELILVDDASLDATYNIMHFYSNTDKRIKIIRNESNSRKSSIEWEPRNDGLKAAKGLLIAYLDSDNLWNSNFLSTCSKPFLNDPNLKLVHCNSRNHYKDEKQYLKIINNDPRTLASGNNKDLTTVYTYETPSIEDSGISWYIDTNEMMHKADIFNDLDYLWSTRHPNRKKINDSQLTKCTYRRHNDQELVERIIKRYGMKALHKEHSVLVDFFYANTQKNFITLNYEDEINRIKEGRVLSVVAKNNDFDSLNIDFFYNSHISNKKNTKQEIFDFGVGELQGNFTAIAKKAFAEYAQQACISQRLMCYGGTASLGSALEKLTNKYIFCGLTDIDVTAITPCDGGHNALFHTFQSLSLNVSSYRKQRPKILFMVPSYPYWTICTAAGCDYGAIEAYNFDSYINGLKETLDKDNVIGIVVNTPHNPLGTSITSNQIEEINIIANQHDCAIIVDIPYHTFYSNENSLEKVDGFDPKRTIYCDSVSKSLALPGLRLGFAISKNRDRSALIRACKSASSLLPSSIKVDFINYLQNTYPEYPQIIQQSVYDKMYRANQYLLSHKFHASIKWEKNSNHTIYDLFHINKTNDLNHLDLTNIDELLQTKYGVIVVTEKKLFPPLLSSKVKSNSIIRLAYGKIENIELGLEKFFYALEDILKINSIR